MDEQIYVVFNDDTYEGMSEVFRGTRQQIKAWLKTTTYALNDLSIYSPQAPDVYELFNEN